jgi:hypothetical protein
MSKNIDPFDELTSRVFSDDSDFYNRTDQLIKKNGAGRYLTKIIALLVIGFISILVSVHFKILWLGVLVFMIMTFFLVKMLTKSNFVFLYIEDYIKRNNR